jgi:hypothetical protein
LPDLCLSVLLDLPLESGGVGRGRMDERCNEFPAWHVAESACLLSEELDELVSAVGDGRGNTGVELFYGDLREIVRQLDL